MVDSKPWRKSLSHKLVSEAPINLAPISHVALRSRCPILQLFGLASPNAGLVRPTLQSTAHTSTLSILKRSRVYHASTHGGREQGSLHQTGQLHCVYASPHANSSASRRNRARISYTLLTVKTNPTVFVSRKTVSFMSLSLRCGSPSLSHDQTS